MSDGWPSTISPIVQVKELHAHCLDRHTLVLSNGSHTSVAVPTEQASQYIQQHSVGQGAWVRLTDYVRKTTTAGVTVVIVKQLEATAAPAALRQVGTAAPAAQRQAGAAAPAAQRHAGATGRATTISALNVYTPSGWVIVARVTNKMPMRTWQNDKGSGTLFSFDVIDSGEGQIRVTCFGDMALQLFDIVEVDGVYEVSGGKLKGANRRFNKLGHLAEINLTPASVVKQVADDTQIGRLQCKYVKLHELSEAAADSIVDVLGVVVDIGVLTEFTSAKTSKMITKRDLTMVDDSNVVCVLTIWGESARLPVGDWRKNAILSAAGARVADYNGRSLSAISSTRLCVDPDIAEAPALRAWFTTTYSSGTARTLSVPHGGGACTDFAGRMTIADIAGRGLGQGDHPDFATVRATVVNTKHDKQGGPWYYACPGGGPAYKVVDHNGKWFCSKTNATYDTKVNRYVLPVVLADHTGTHYTSFFDEQATQLLGGVTADALEDMAADSQQCQGVWTKALFTACTVRLRVKQEQHDGKMHMKYAVLEFKPLDYKAECQGLLDSINDAGASE
jgi:replication factor A1